MRSGYVTDSRRQAYVDLRSLTGDLAQLVDGVFVFLEVQLQSLREGVESFLLCFPLRGNFNVYRPRHITPEVRVRGQRDGQM